MLPTFLTLILLALQPVCLLYTRAVMESAAAETARLMTTTTAEDDDLMEFARRRLAAVPNVSIFHAGGPLSWDIELGRAGAGGVSSVSVSGEVKPLPVIGAFAQAMGGTAEGGYVELKVDVSYQSRPEWLEGDYDSFEAATYFTLPSALRTIDSLMKPLKKEHGTPVTNPHSLRLLS